MKLIPVSLAAAAALSICCGKPDPRLDFWPCDTQQLSPFSKTESTQEDVFFATNRQPSGPSDFGSTEGPLVFGTGTASITEESKKGLYFANMEGPLQWDFVQVQPLSRYSWLQAIGQRAETKTVTPLRPMGDLIVYIHGFANSFRAAECRAAEIQHRTRFQGTFVTFSWPSSPSITSWSGSLTPDVYDTDRRMADASTTAFRRMLTGLATKVPPSRTILIAHSMGSRILVNALAQLPVPESYRVAVLLAPDVGVNELSKQLDSLLQRVRRMSVYFNRKDEALEASGRINLEPRAGAVALPRRDPRVELIDITDVPDFGLVPRLHHADHLLRTALYDLLWNAVRDMPAQCRGKRGLARYQDGIWVLRPSDGPYTSADVSPECQLGIAVR